MTKVGQWECRDVNIFNKLYEAQSGTDSKPYKAKFIKLE